MDLFETTQTIKGWINSCTKAEQLDLCNEVVQEFVLDKFAGKVTVMEYDEAKTNLYAALNDRRIIVASHTKPPERTHCTYI